MWLVNVFPIVYQVGRTKIFLVSYFHHKVNGWKLGHYPCIRYYKLVSEIKIKIFVLSFVFVLNFFFLLVRFFFQLFFFWLFSFKEFDSFKFITVIHLILCVFLHHIWRTFTVDNLLSLVQRHKRIYLEPYKLHQVFKIYYC